LAVACHFVLLRELVRSCAHAICLKCFGNHWKLGTYTNTVK
jgi:hypothetical protein